MKLSEHTKPLKNREIERDAKLVQIKWRVTMDVVAYAGSDEVEKFAKTLADENFERVDKVAVTPIVYYDPKRISKSDQATCNIYTKSKKSVAHKGIKGWKYEYIVRDTIASFEINRNEIEAIEVIET